MTEPVWSPASPNFDRAIQAQARAADPERSAWVEANAGSGKTKVLIDRVARLLLRRPDGRPGAPPDTILCVTYTKAAANEMLSRLFERLGSWSIYDDQRLQIELARLEGRSPDDYDRDTLDQARSLFARALETPGGLRIETIHAFCARILRRFPLEAGIAPGFEEMDDDQAARLWRQTLDDTIEHAVLSEPEAFRLISETAGGRGLEAPIEALRDHREALLQLAHALDLNRTPLSDVIYDALDAPPDTPSAIIDRCMGADFPRDDVRRAWLELTSGADPEVTAKKTNQTLATRLDAVLNAPSAEEAFSRYMASISGSKGDWPTGTNPYAGAPLDHSLVASLFRRNLSKGEPEGSEIHRMKKADAAYRTARTAEQSIALLKLGLPIIRHYQTLKRQRALLDFDDLIHHTLHLLSQSTAAQWVLYKLDGGLSHILLDEAQDTSPAQWQLMNALIAEFHAGTGRERLGDPRTQFVVGDPKQSIYSFQGADQEQFKIEQMAFAKQQASLYGRANIPEMTMSFRSSPEILAFVDAVRTTVPLDDDELDPVPDLEDSFQPHIARRSNQPGRVEVWPLFRSRRDEIKDNWLTPTDHISDLAPTRQLAAGIADYIKTVLDNREAVWREQNNGAWQYEPAHAGDVLILLRRRSALFHSIISELKRREIPVAGADRLRLTENIGVQDCLNLMRFALQPNDDLCLAEILRGPFCNLVDDDQHLFRLAYGRGPTETLWDRLQSLQDDTFEHAREFCAHLISTRTLSAFDFLNQHLNSTDVKGVSGWDRLLGRLGEPARDPIQALINKALGHALTRPASLQHFLADIDVDDSELKRELGEAGNAVRVMTIHGAKGLQAPIVILPDTCSPTQATKNTVFKTPTGIPLYAPKAVSDCSVTRHLRSQENAANEKESRRLLYVALTRAQDRLVLCGAARGNEKRGYAASSWYRWGLLAMRHLLSEDIPEDGPDEVLVFGDAVQHGTAHPVTSGQTSMIPGWLKKSVGPAVPNILLAAPSRLGREDKTPISNIAASVRQHSLRRGQLIHQLLEHLPSTSQDRWTRVAKAFLDHVPDLSADLKSEILKTTLATLEHDEFAEIFFGPGRSEAAIVGKLENGLAINGRVDRLVIEDHRIRIVDYKTDRPAPENPSEVDTSYKVQMAAYAEITKQLYPDRTVECALLYTDGPNLIVLNPLDLSETLNGLKTDV